MKTADQVRTQPQSSAVFLFARAVITTVALFPSSVAGEGLAIPEREFFESRIRPVLVEHCYSCHNSVDTAEGGLIVDHRAAFLRGAFLRGGEGGRVIVPGEPEASRLLQVLRHEIDGLEMPSGGPKLDDSVVRDFENWIRMGAPDPRATAPTAAEVQAATSWEATLAGRKQWWSFQPVRSYQVPDAGSEWSHAAVDRFIFRKLEQANLSPAASAGPAVLVRRLFFSLIGMPPTPAQAEKWTRRLTEAEGDERFSIVAELADELLASPHFGERWARHWMDWVRYAESHGSEADPLNENAWYYRDYLIRALNADVRCDQLIREHVAGDLLAEPRINPELGINESAIGPAHFRMVFHGFAPTDALDEKVRFTDDQINAFSKAFLGLTVSCARCHDHKFDAISQKDYYALFGILASCRPARTIINLPDQLEQHRAQLSEQREKIRSAVVDAWLADLPSLAERLVSGDLEVAMNAKRSGKSIIEQLMLPRRPLLWPVASIRQAMNKQASFSTALNDVLDDFKSRHEAVNTSLAQDCVRRWDLSSAKDYQAWFGTGNGLPRLPSKPGEFAIASSGASVLTGIYPAGVYSHTLSSKHAARLTSPEFSVPEDCRLVVETVGAGGATARYVVENYPRRGTVYPVSTLADSWEWQRYDLAYWSGENLHIELTTAKDAPLLTGRQPRSWFGVRRVRLFRNDQPDPGESLEHLAPIMKSVMQNPPESLRGFCNQIADTVGDALRAWQQGTITDEQALLLDACLRSDVVANDLKTLPDVRPLVEEYRRLEKEVIVPIRVPGLQETVAINQPLFVRGDHKQPAAEVPRRFLEAIDPTPYGTRLSGRDRLAEDLLRADNPLTRRVIVNRVWHHLFGRGIVATPGNFGRLGSPPTHRELLDWLASDFADNGWSLKSLIRSLVLSKTWQQSSLSTVAAARTDPENQLLSHANVRRLEAEAIRDSLLRVSGQLQDDVFGPPVTGTAPRRSIYMKVIRNSLDPFLRAFDFPEPFSSVGRRDVTNVPAQSLALMNNNQTVQYARAWAERVPGDEQLTS